ncbi:MAG: methionyl-tRNA formyltransferase [Dehalococcoidia bacterium]
MPIVFIGTPPFAVLPLRRLVAEGYEVSAVYTQPDRPTGRGRKTVPPAVKTAAAELGLPLYQPPSLRDPAVVAHLRSLAPEVIAAVAYGQLIRPDVLAIPPRGVLNVHPSLLPRWRGASPVAAAILAGDKETGVTIMRMNEGLDSGPIIAQRVTPISADDTTGALTSALAEVGAGLLVETLARWLAGEIEAVPQDESQATVCRQLRKSDGIIDWSLPAEDIWRRVRAYNPWPGAHTFLNGEPFHIWRAQPLAEESVEAPGTVIATSEAPFAVQTGRGLLAVLEAQRAGRRPLPADELLRGMSALIGRRFDSTANETGEAHSPPP